VTALFVSNYVEGKIFGNDSNKQNYMPEGNKNRLFSGNACYRRVQNISSSNLKSKIKNRSNYICA
jgi:hypothetical protein